MTPTISLTARDFDTNLAFLQGKVKEAAPALWNSFEAGDLGTVLLEVMAWDASLLTFMADTQFQECFLDSLRNRESLVHFARLSGYQVRRNSPASVSVYATSSAAPTAPEYLLIRRGTKTRSRDGQVWEVAADYRILPGTRTPVRIVTGYDNIRTSFINESGITVESGALVKIVQGTAYAILVNDLGDRLPSSTGFGTASPGHVLKLTSQKSGSSFGAAPVVTNREYAVISTGQLEFDQYPGSVIYLDREWDLPDYTGKWVLEDRAITLVQGESQEDRNVAPADTANLAYVTSFYPVISGFSSSFAASGLIDSSPESGIEVYVDGAQWRETASLLFEGPSEQAFEIDFDAQDRALIKFGNGLNGGLVPSGAEITIRYRTGGGVSGNITQGAFDTSIAGTAVPATNNSPTVFITNPYMAASGGMDRETLEEAKTNIQAFIRTNDRAVSHGDYVHLSETYSDPAAGRVAHATAILKKNAVPREQNLIWVYVWAEGTGGQYVAPSLALKQNLLSHLNQRKMITDEVVVIDGISVRTPLYFHYQYATTKEEWEIKEAIRTSIASVMTSLLPGQTLMLSKLYEAMEATDGVDMVIFHHPSINIVPVDECNLLVNSVTEPSPGRLIADAAIGALNISVSHPAAFVNGGMVMLIENGKPTTVGEVDTVSGSIVTLKSATPLLADYTVPDAAGRGCEVYNSDFVGVGWQYEKKVDVHVTYTTLFGAIATMDASIANKIKHFFTYTVRPEQTLLRANIEHIVSTTSGVLTQSARFGSVDGTTETVSSSLREKLVLGSLTINGVSY